MRRSDRNARRPRAGRPRLERARWSAVALAAFGLASPALARAPVDPVAAAPDGTLDVRVWTRTEGLPQDSALALASDPDGYLWVGTQGGLARFDGHAFRVHDIGNTPELPTNRITVLRRCRDGALWIGGEAGLARFRDGVFDTVALPRDEQVRAIAEDDRGRHWIGTDRGLFVLEGERVREVAPTWIASDRAVLSLAIAPDGAVWAGGIAGVARIDDDGARLFRAPGLYEVWSVAVAPDGDVWLGSRDGVWSIPSGAERPSRVHRFDGAVHALSFDLDGNLWVGASGVHLLARDRAEVVTSLTPDAYPGLPQRVRALSRDARGNLWIGGALGGLARVRASRVVSLGPRARVDGLATTAEGDVWVSFLTAGTHAVRTPGLEELAVDVGRLFVDRRGDRWVANLKGIRRYPADGAAPRVERIPFLGRVHAFHETDDGTLWVGGQGGVVRFSPDRASVDVPDAPPATYVRVIASAPDGSVWIGSDAGLTRVDGDDVRTYGPDDGLSRGTVRAIHVDPDGTLWIGTYGGGISRYRDGRFTRVTTEDGLREPFVSTLFDDGEGHFWANGNLGVSRLSRASLERAADGRGQVEAALVATGEGQGGFSPSVARGADGVLWFATVAGLRGILPSDTPGAVIRPETRVERVTLDGREVGLEDGTIVVPPGSSADLRIEYTAIDFERPEELRFEHRLDGLDDAWVRAEGRRTAYYAGLRPGDYTFRVRAARAGGAPGPVAVGPRIDVGRPWSHNPWLRGFGAVLVVAGVAAFYRGRVRKVRRHNAQLLHEIAERERAEAALRETERQLHDAARLEAVGKLAGGVAHDFNNLLTVISAAGARLRRHLDGAAEGPRLLAHVDEATDRAATLTRRLLAFGQRQDLRPEVLSLDRLLEDLESMLRRVVPESIEIVRVAGAATGAVRVDPAQLEQVVINLAINARDAMPCGGTLTFETSAVHLPREHAAAGLPEGEYVALEVRDTGSGIEEAIRPFVFDPFFTTKGRAEGSGLGLSTVYGIVTQSGGAVAVESEPGVGTTFRILLPRAADAAENSGLEGLPGWQPHVPGGETILVVEDETTVRDLMRDILESSGFDVLAAATPSEALRAAETHAGTVDLLLTDVVLPEMSGIELADALAARFGPQRVILTSGYAPDSLAIPETFDATEGFLSKPFTPEQLLTRVRERLRRPRADDGAQEAG